MALTEPQVEAFRSLSKKTKLPDGVGLYVGVLPSGSKTFWLTYRVAGKQRAARKE